MNSSRLSIFRFSQKASRISATLLLALISKTIADYYLPVQGAAAL
jgi:hypothetical protein